MTTFSLPNSIIKNNNRAMLARLLFLTTSTVRCGIMARSHVGRIGGFMPGEILYKVPVFPLNTVLFPSMPLPLHIFEERYRAMVQDIKHGDKRFCVALIKEGEEVGSDAAPCQVACLAEVVHLQALADGRYFLLAVGVERVRILSTGHN